MFLVSVSSFKLSIYDTQTIIATPDELVAIGETFPQVPAQVRNIHLLGDGRVICIEKVTYNQKEYDGIPAAVLQDFWDRRASIAAALVTYRASLEAPHP